MRMTVRRTCAHPGCGAAAGGVLCQDCGKAFCAAHAAATEFSGPRRDGARATRWIRFVCEACVGAADRALRTAAARAAGEQEAGDRRGRWWTARPPVALVSPDGGPADGPPAP